MNVHARTVTMAMLCASFRPGRTLPPQMALVSPGVQQWPAVMTTSGWMNMPVPGVASVRHGGPRVRSKHGTRCRRCTRYAPTGVDSTPPPPVSC